MDVESIMNELCDHKALGSVDPALRRRLMWMIANSLPPVDVDNASMPVRDLHPIDVPIEYAKDEKTGDLLIRHAYLIAARPSVPAHLHWRETQVTQAAQRDLLEIFRESIAADEAAGRIPPKPIPLQ